MPEKELTMSTKPKYQQALSAVYEELGTDEHGLQQSAASQRLEQYGPNALNQQKRLPCCKNLLRSSRIS